MKPLNTCMHLAHAIPMHAPGAHISACSKGVASTHACMPCLRYTETSARSYCCGASVVAVGAVLFLHFPLLSGCRLMLLDRLRLRLLGAGYCFVSATQVRVAVAGCFGPR